MRVPLEESIVAGLWRVYAFDDKSWALEPVGVSDTAAARKREYFDNLSDALSKLLSKELGDGARTIVREFHSALRAAEERVRQSVFELSEYARLKGLAV